MKAAIYTRVSTEEQAEEGKESLPVQLADCLAYCERRGYEPLEPYVDVQSGADLKKKRPAFERMLADIRAGAVDVVIVWAYDRVFRDLRPMVDLRDALKAADIEIEGVALPLNRATLTPMAWVAEMELDNLRRRTKMGKRGMAKKGFYACGIAPYGYSYDKPSKQLVVDEGEAAVVRRIYSLYEEGLAFRAIARLLNAEGVPTRGAGIRSKDGVRYGWVAPLIGRILASPTYKGQWHYARPPAKDGRKRPVEAQEAIIVKVPRIVTDAAWEQARRRRERNKHHSQGHEASGLFYLLRGVLFCDECGRSFKCHGTPAGAVRLDSRRNPFTVRTEYRAYGCLGQHEHPEIYQCRRPWRVRAQDIEGPVWQKIQAILREPALLHEAAEANLGELQAADVQNTGLIAKRRRQVTEIERLTKGVIRMAAAEQITPEEMRAQLDGLEAERKMWQDELSRLTQAAEWRTQAKETVELLQQFCQDIGPTLDHLTSAERREILLQLVDKVWLDGEGQIRLEGQISRFTGDPGEKEARLVAAATAYVQALAEPPADQRIDVVAVQLSPGGRLLAIDHIEGAVIEREPI